MDKILADTDTMETTMSKIYSALIEVSKTRNLEKLEHHSNAFQAARKFVDSSAMPHFGKGNAGPFSKDRGPPSGYE